MNKLIISLCALCFVLAGCGVSQETKALTNDVWGYGGVSDQYIDVAGSITENQIVIMKAIQEQQGDDFELMVTRPDGEKRQVSIVVWIEALEKFLGVGPKLKEAGHAVNDAVQADKGLSAFTEQLMRTLKADEVLDWFLGG